MSRCTSKALRMAFFAFLTGLGIYDVVQVRHSILRNYPIMGHLRFLFEGIRPEIRQYLMESDQDEEPFSRDKRSIIYQRAKGVEDKRPFGTRERVYDSGYEWITHSIRAHIMAVYCCCPDDNVQADQNST